MLHVTKEQAIEHIDYVLMQDVILSIGPQDTDIARGAEREALFAAVFRRLCPPQSPYYEVLNSYHDQNLDAKKGVLAALRAAYEKGWLQTFTELVHEELLSDFLGMAEQLLSEKKKDPAAMYAGGVLEDHLRNLCKKNGIDTTHTDKHGVVHRKMIDRMSNELKDKAYGSVHHKQIIAWGGIRNAAAHAEYHLYDTLQVEMMVEGLRNFMATYPA